MKKLLSGLVGLALAASVSAGTPCAQRDRIECKTNERKVETVLGSDCTVQCVPVYKQRVSKQKLPSPSAFGGLGSMEDYVREAHRSNFTGYGTGPSAQDIKRKVAHDFNVAGRKIHNMEPVQPKENAMTPEQYRAMKNRIQEYSLARRDASLDSLLDSLRSRIETEDRGWLGYKPKAPESTPNSRAYAPTDVVSAPSSYQARTAKGGIKIYDAFLKLSPEGNSILTVDFEDNKPRAKVQLYLNKFGPQEFDADNAKIQGIHGRRRMYTGVFGIPVSLMALDYKVLITDSDGNRGIFPLRSNFPGKE